MDCCYRNSNPSPSFSYYLRFILQKQNFSSQSERCQTRPPPAEAASGQAFSGNPAGALGAAAHGLMFEMYTLVSMCLKKWNVTTASHIIKLLQ